MRKFPGVSWKLGHKNILQMGKGQRNRGSEGKGLRKGV